MATRLALAAAFVLGAAVGGFRVPGTASSAGRDAPVGAYRAEVLRVVDGDTIEARVRIWLGQEIVTRVRLAGVDAPELRSRCPHEGERARQARQALAGLVEGRAVTLADIGPDKYFGRIVARVALDDGGDVGARLLADGHARPYGRRRADWCTG